MDTAVAVVKLGAVWLALVTMVLSLLLSYTAGLDARSAARSAAFAAATALGRDWNCQPTGTKWAVAETVAAEASGHRLAGNTRLIVTDFGLTADPRYLHRPRSVADSPRQRRTVVVDRPCPCRRMRPHPVDRAATTHRLRTGNLTWTR